MVTTQWSDRDSTAAAVYFVKCGFGKDTMTVFPLGGNTGTLGISQQRGTIRIDSIFSKLVTWWRLS